MKRLLAMVCLVVMMASLLPLYALAESPFFTDDVVLCPEADAGVSRYVFLYTGEDEGWFGSSNSVELDIERGYIYVYTDETFNFQQEWELYSAYPSMEARVWRWDSSQQQWVREQKFDIYSENDATVEFAEENAVYCLHLYFWNPVTVVKSYDKNWEFYMYTGIHKTKCLARGDVVGGHWSENDLPQVTISAGDTVIFHEGNPTPVMPAEQ